MKVFISSTYEDLQAERETILSLITRLKASFVGMEIFPATAKTPKELALRTISECDAAIFIVAHRYGTIDPESYKSIVHLEYDAALSNNKEILVYFKDDRATITIDQVDFKNAEKLAFFKSVLEKHHNRRFRNPDELATLVALDILDRFAKGGRWIGLSPRIYDRYRQFWSDTLQGKPVALILEVGKYPAHPGEVEFAKNINGVLGISKIIPALSQIGIELSVEPATEGIALNRNLILDGSHTGNSITKRAVEHDNLANRLIYANRHSQDYRTRWLENLRDPEEKFATTYRKEHRSKRLSYDFGFLARVRNPFGPSGNCLIASGNHGAGTYACMQALSSPDLLEKIVQQIGSAEFQAVVGIEAGGLFSLGDPVIHKIVKIE